MKLTDAQTAIIEEEIAAELKGVATRKAHADLSKRWPGGVVPYTISSESSGDTAVIQSAIAHWESLTCLNISAIQCNRRTHGKD
ncbi:protein SpAN-like [Saccoglossus kowalevskii]|uniref:Protein SpAN-like n=1 Tax=Saccoglossus kowalevskii TaxID=10224 RepID=A0ABM0N1A2_SACKO|nr:PREDICTED: protein SpAN-like [Saccoglossus kowalevskii]